MVNWTQEDVEFITRHIVVPCFEEFMKAELDFNKNSMDTCGKMIDMTVEEIGKRLRECEYNMYRDRSYFLAFLSQTNGFTQSSLQETYKHYCEEYDKLNKHLLDDKKEIDK